MATLGTLWMNGCALSLRCCMPMGLGAQRRYRLKRAVGDASSADMTRLTRLEGWSVQPSTGVVELSRGSIIAAPLEAWIEPGLGVLGAKTYREC
jgi:hypothetical protein